MNYEGGALRFKILIGIMFFLLALMDLAKSQNYFERSYKPFWYFKGSSATDIALANNNTISSGAVSALSNNPALIGKQNNVVTGLSISHNLFQQRGKIGNNYFPSSNDFTKSNQNHNGIDNFGIVYPVSVYQGSFVIGLSYSNRVRYNYKSKASGQAIDLFTNYNYAVREVSEKINQKGSLNSYNAGFALELQKDFFLGLSLHFYSGERNHTMRSKEYYKENYPYNDTHIIESRINSEYNSFNLSIGSLYKGEHFEFGLKLTSPLTIHSQDNWNIDTVWNYEGGGTWDTTITDNNFEYKMSYPITISTGLAYKINNIKFSLDLALLNWDEIDYIIKEKAYFNPGYKNSGKIENSVSKLIGSNLKSTINYGFGIQYFAKNMEINAGYRLMNKPKKNLDEQFSKLNLFGLGLNYNLTEKFTLGLGYQYSHGKNKGSPYFLTRKEEHYNNHRVVMTAELNITKQEQKDY